MLGDRCDSTSPGYQVVAPQRRRTSDAGTAISSVLQFSDRQLQLAPFQAVREVIDLIADGKDNYRKPVEPARDSVLANDITINALAIRNQVSDLTQYLTATGRRD